MLQDITNTMILAKDVMDDCDRILLAAGTKLKPELIDLLNRYHINSVWVTVLSDNHEITALQDPVDMATRVKLVKDIEKAFYSEEGIASYLPYLSKNIENIVGQVVLHNDVLIYLKDINLKSDYLFVHSVNVGLFSIALGKAMGLSQADLCVLGMGGLLHDLGKIHISRSIIDKNGALTEAEFEEMKRHPLEGYNILKDAGDMDKRVMLIALQHHERYAGLGYPQNIKGEEIHHLSRIVAVADVYDALITDRVYRPRLEPPEAMKIVLAGEGIQFDEKVIEAFKKITVPYMIGKVVELSNGLRGMVMRLNAANLSRPVVWTAKGNINLLQEKQVNIVL